MKKSDIKTVPDYFKQYISLVEDHSIIDQLEIGGIEPYLAQIDQLNELGDQVYAEGKWTIKQILQHLIDCDIIFLNRALRFLREDKTDLPGFEENDYAKSARVSHKTVSGLLEELQIVRMSAYHLFKDLNTVEWQRSGTANNKEISVLAIACIMVGHAYHHFNVIQERYIPLLDQ